MEKARRLGAKSARLVDAQEELCRDLAFPVLQFQAKYEGIYLLGTSIARPLICEDLRRGCPRGRRRCVRPRGDRQGQRPVPVPVGRRGAGPRGPRDRPVADREVPQPVPRPQRDDRLLQGKEHPRQGVGRQAVQLGRELPAHQLRGRATRRPRRQRRRPGRVRHGHQAAGRPGQNRERLDRLRVGRARGRQRREAQPLPDRPDAQRDRRAQRRRAGRHGREPFRGHEEPRRVRGPGHDAACTKPTGSSSS